MDSKLLHHLHRQFRIGTRTVLPGRTPPYFRVFDRTEEEMVGWKFSPPRWSESEFRQFRNRLKVCEVYLYDGPDQGTLTLEMLDVYSICREELADFVRQCEGAVEDNDSKWTARISIPLSGSGAEQVRQMAAIVAHSQRRGVRSRHRILKLADALMRTADAIALTAKRCEEVVQNGPGRK